MQVVELHRDFSERFPYACTERTAFSLSENEKQNETFELLFYGEGAHHNLAEMAKQFHPEVELYIKKE